MKKIAMRFIFVLAVYSILLATSLWVIPFAQSATVSRGNLVGQSVKFTQGAVAIEKNGASFSIQLGSNFKTKRGPALYLYLGNGSPQKRIGKLKSATGAQTYKIPSSVDPSNYSTLYIYCVPFQAIFGKAHLR